MVLEKLYQPIFLLLIYFPNTLTIRKDQAG